MPFTLSHAAAVLPLIRRTGAARGPLVASALVAGSFAPDVTYYADTVVPGGMAFGTVTHAPAGVVTVDVLLTAVLVGGWLLVRAPLLALLLGTGYRTLRAYAVHGATVGWFDYLPDLLFGAGAGLVPGLLVCAAAFRLLDRRTRRSGSAADGTAPGRPAGAGAEAT